MESNWQAAIDFVLEAEGSMGVYQILNKSNMKIYIGSSINIQNRLKEHKRKLGYGTHINKHLQSAWLLNNLDFETSVIEVVHDKQLLLAREQYWLDCLEPFGIKGYNICKVAGNTLGRKHTQKTKERMSALKIGHVVSDETRAKLKASRRKGRLGGNWKVFTLVSPEGDTFTTDNLTRFANEHGLSVSALSHIAAKDTRLQTNKGWTCSK